MTQASPESAAPEPSEALAPEGPTSISEGTAPAEGTAPSEGTGDTSGEDEELSATTMYLILGALVVLLLVVLVIQVPAIQTQLRFRNLQEGLAQPTPSVDQETIDSLLAEGPELLPSLAEELDVGGVHRERYRVLLIVRILTPMAGEEASQVLLALVGDRSPAVRANVYLQHQARVEAKHLDRKVAIESLVKSYLRETDPVARACAAKALVQLGEERGTWPLIEGIRRMSATGRHLIPDLFATLKTVLGPELKFDHTATPEIQIRQMEAIEAAYQAQGGKIPPGQDLKSIMKKSPSGALAPVDSASDASASGGAGQ